MTTEDRLDLLEYRQELLFENSDYSRYLFECKVTREENEAISEVFKDFSKKILAGEKVYSGTYEQNIYEAVPHQKGIYHFAETLAQLKHEDGTWPDVFETLYGDEQKFSYYMKKHREQS